MLESRLNNTNSIPFDKSRFFPDTYFSSTSSIFALLFLISFRTYNKFVSLVENCEFVAWTCNTWIAYFILRRKWDVVYFEATVGVIVGVFLLGRALKIVGRTQWEKCTQLRDHDNKMENLIYSKSKTRFGRLAMKRCQFNHVSRNRLISNATG